MLSEVFPDKYVLRNEPMKFHTTMRIGGNAKYFVTVPTVEKLVDLVNMCREENEKILILGNASNVLIPDEGFDGVIISTDFKTESDNVIAKHYESLGEHVISKVNFYDLKVHDEKFFLDRGYPFVASQCDADFVAITGCGTKLSSFVHKAAEHSLANMEFAAGIPGSVGGAVAMNAGAYGNEIKDFIIGAKVLTNYGEVIFMNKDELALEYRNSIIQKRDLIVISAIFGLKRGDKKDIISKIKELNSRRKEKQPLEYPSAGSTFKRPEGAYAAQLIEECGMKGYKVGDMMISYKHAGFMINTGNGNFKDAVTLIQKVQDVVFEKRGIRLEPEVKIIS